MSGAPAANRGKRGAILDTSEPASISLEFRRSIGKRVDSGCWALGFQADSAARLRVDG